MEKIPKDVLILIALEFDLREILKFCSTSKYINRTICESQIFWRKKISREYPHLNINNVEKFRNLYNYLKLRTEYSKDAKLGYLLDDDKIYLPRKGETINISSLTVRDIPVNFPKYPPEFFADILHTNIFSLSRRSIQQIAKNRIGNKSFIIGNYGEEYSVILTGADEKQMKKWIKYMTNLFNHLARFQSGLITLNIKDDFSS